jgi:hypothetical protein
MALAIKIEFCHYGLCVADDLTTPHDENTHRFLVVNSPAIDAGNDLNCVGQFVNSIDQRGEIRPVGDHCDIGAFEGTVDTGGFFVIPLPGDKTVIIPSG